MGARFSSPVQTGPVAHPASCTMGIESFPGVKSSRDVTLTPHPLLVPWSRKSRAIPLLPLWAVGPVQSLSTCTRVYFALFTGWSSSDEAWFCLNRHLGVRITDISLHNVPCQCRQCPVLDVCVRCVMTVNRVGEPVFSENINSHPYVRHVLTQFLNIYGTPHARQAGNSQDRCSSRRHAEM